MVLRAAMIPPLFRVPLLLAGAACVAAPLLLAPRERAVAVGPQAVTASAAASVAPAETPTTRSLAYYPEQLAALSSLNGFQPLADPGRPAIAATASPAQSAGHSAAQDAPAARRIARPEAPRRPALASAAAPATPNAAPHAEPQGWSLFGVKLPKPGWPDSDALRRQADNWREAAGGQAAALGDRLAHLWR